MLAHRSVFLAAALAAISSAGTLSIRGDRFLLDGKPFDMWGVRVASASQSDDLTRQLIANLDDYKRHGVNAISVYFMGSSAAYLSWIACQSLPCMPGS